MCDTGGTQDLDGSIEDCDASGEQEEVEIPEHWGKLIQCGSQLRIEPIYLSEPDKKYSIGRNGDIKIDNCMVVSGIHCVIFRDAGVAFLEDKSTNGTFINGTKVGKNKKVILSSGTKIVVAKKNQKQKVDEEIAYLYFDGAEQKQQGGPFDTYIVKEILGSGAFATVRLAIHKETHDKVAIKIISKKKFCKSAGHGRENALMDEVEILKQINHPGVVGIREVFETDDTLYLVLELVTGGELFDLINEKQIFTDDEARELFVQMVDAIVYLHDKGIVHRDLKFENILLQDEKKNVIKISDFGLSRIISEGSFMKTICGTPEYLAPEVLTKSKTTGYSKSVDIWSLGVILYTMLCGYRPFEGTENGETVFDKITKGLFEYPDDVELTDAAKDLINQMLTVNPAHRITAVAIRNHPWVTNEPAFVGKKRARNPPEASKAKRQKV